MAFSHSHGCAQVQVQRLEQRLTQVIELSHLLAVPDQVLNVVAGAISYNPDAIESTLVKAREQKERLHQDMAQRVETIYTSLTPSKGGDTNGGVIISPDIRALENALRVPTSIVTPDVVYIGRKNDKPELVLSDHLKGAIGLFLLQLDQTKYPETSRLLAQLRKFDEWKRGKLREAYTILGGEQRKYLETLNPIHLEIYLQDDLAEQLNIHGSTVGRILSNRWVEARNTSGEQKVFYAKNLFASQTRIIALEYVPRMNQALAEEFETGEALSDLDIAKKVGGKFARRTVAKYRAENNVPPRNVRAKLYASKSRETPFEMKTLEA